MRRPNGQVTDGLTHRRAHATDGCLWRGARRSPRCVAEQSSDSGGAGDGPATTQLAPSFGRNLALSLLRGPIHSAARQKGKPCPEQYDTPIRAAAHSLSAVSRRCASPGVVMQSSRSRSGESATPDPAAMWRPPHPGPSPARSFPPCSCTTPPFARLTPIFMSACCCCATRIGWISTAGQIIRHMQTVRPIRSPGFVPPWRPRQG